MKRKLFKRFLICMLTALTITGICRANDAFMKKKVKLNKTSVTLKVGKKYKLKVKNTKAKVKWKSNKKKVATVSKKGVVTAKKKGKATITAKIGKKKLTCKIKVVKAGTSIPSPTSKPAATKKPGTSSSATSAKPTKAPKDSLIAQPTANPSTKDDGWVPGWY